MSSSVRLAPMPADQFRAYRDIAERTYAYNIVKSGMMPEPEALQKATEDFENLLPDGVDTDGHEFWTALDADKEVGMLWLAFTEKSDGLHAFGYDFLVTSELRRQGYGRAIMAAAEEVCRERGVVEVGLSVFGFNSDARALYEQMGFEVTAVQMRRRLWTVGTALGEDLEERPWGLIDLRVSDPDGHYLRFTKSPLTYPIYQHV